MQAGKFSYRQEEIEVAFEEYESGSDDSMKKYVELCTNRLEGLIRLVQGDLSKEDRVKIITVITIDVHNRDVVQNLVSKKVESNVDFKWQMLFRKSISFISMSDKCGIGIAIF